jgi:hypothetical protein
MTNEEEESIKLGTPRIEIGYNDVNNTFSEIGST